MKAEKEKSGINRHCSNATGISIGRPEDGPRALPWADLFSPFGAIRMPGFLAILPRRG